MIPYDDLVVALQTWRALKGLPVAQLSGALTPPPVAPPPPARAAAPARPAAPGRPAPGSGPQRSARPPAPAGRAQAPIVAAPPPLAAPDETLDEGSLSLLDEASLEEHLGAGIDESGYVGDGDNFSIPFDARNAIAHHEEGDESTSVGQVPARPSDMDATNPHGDPTMPRAPNRNDDW